MLAVHRPEVVERELAHLPGDAENWQESLLLVWGDPTAGIGGFHRIGHEPNKGSGDLWSGVVTPHHSFRRDSDKVPVLEGDREIPRFALDTHSFTLDADGRMAFRIDEPELSLQLVCEDFAPLAPIFSPDHLESVGRSTISNHLECHGRVEGRLTIRGETTEIDALCVRDHSWGPRDWSTIVSHRWVAGSLGPDLSFSAIVMQGLDGRFQTVGVVIRDGNALQATAIEIVVALEADGLSHRGGSMHMSLADGSDFAIEIETSDGWFFNAYSHIEVDTICRARTPDGRVGFCDLEVSNGRRITDPLVGIRAATHDGLKSRDLTGGS